MLPHPLPRARIFFPFRKWVRDYLPRFLDAMTWSLTVRKKLQCLFENGSFDAIEFPETMGEGLLIPNTKARLVCRVHSSWLASFGRNILERKLLLLIQKLSCEKANVLISPSKFMANNYCRGQLHIKKSIQIIPNPFTSWPHPIPLKKRNKHRILFVGRIEYRKGIHLLLSALDLMGKEAENIELRVVGALPPNPQGEDETVVNIFKDKLQKSQKQGYDWKLEYCGESAHQELWRHYDWASLLVFPSLQDNLPYVLIEAISRGCFILASQTGGIPEIVEEPEYGWTFLVGDPQSLAEKMRKWIHADYQIPADKITRALKKYAPKKWLESMWNIYACETMERQKSQLLQNKKMY